MSDGWDPREFFTESQRGPGRPALEVAEEQCVAVARWSPAELLEEVASREELVERADRFEEWWLWSIDGMPLLGWPDGERPRGMFYRLHWCPEAEEAPEVLARIEATLRAMGAREPSEWIAEIVTVGDGGDPKPLASVRYVERDR